MMPTTNDLHEPDLDALDELHDFDSEDFEDVEETGHDYLDRMWDRHGFGSRDEQDILVAHGMVQGFVNSFGRDGRYEVVFDPNIGTAGTNQDTRRVAITPSPILDRSISAQEAGRVLTALATHEISHPRYGKITHNAVRNVFPRSTAAWRLSNLLDDVRIERRFVADYPGYAGIFDAALDYLKRGMLARSGGALIRPSLDDQTNLATAAVRYADAFDWTGLEAERDWWQTWARTWARENSPKRHIEAVRVALQHIVANNVREELRREQERAEAEKQRQAEAESAAREPDPTPDEDAPVTGASEGEEADESDATGGFGDDDLEDDPDAADEAEDDDEPVSSGDDEDDIEDAQPSGDAADPAEEAGPTDAAGADSDNDLDDDEPIEADGLDGDIEADDEDVSDDHIERGVESLSDEELADGADAGAPQTPLPDCADRSAIDGAAVNLGVSPHEIRDAIEEAQQAVEDAKYTEDDGHGGSVDVARSLRGLIRGRVDNRWSPTFTKSDVAARYIRDALMRSRTGHTDTSHYQKRGRLDQQALHRLTKHDYRLFDRRRSTSPGKYLIWMLLDRSGSMDGMESMQAAQVATAIADATRHVRTVRAAVWAWSDNFRNAHAYGAGAALAWRTGMPTTDIAKTIDLPSGGTPDGTIMGWASQAIVKDLRSGETPVIIMCSDGWGESSLGDRVAEARKRGVVVVSVAFGNLDEETQQSRFGRDGYVAWQGDIIRTSRPLAKLIARIVGRDRREGR